VQDRHRASIDEFLDQVEVLVQRLDDSGLLAPGLQTRAAAIGMFCIVDGMMRQWTMNPRSFELLPTGQQAVQSYLQGLLPREARGAALTAAGPGAPG
jgi:TetR/AcrR family transcriptional regulator, acrAB operon repressor